MVRFLNLLILSLNTWSDVRHRISLSVTATLLTGVASLVVVSTVAADNSVQYSWFHRIQKQSEALTSSTKPQKSQANRGLPTTKHTELRITGKDPDTAGSRSDSATSSSAGATPKVNDNKSTPDSPASNSNTAQGQTELVNDMQLAVPQLVCQQGQPVWSVASGELKMQTALAVDGSVMWAWEVRVDSGGGNSNASPIDTSVHSQAASAGQTDITLTTNSNQSGPLVTAPESVDYGYSFRLHVTAPVDAASDWVSVPQASGSGC